VKQYRVQVFFANNDNKGDRAFISTPKRGGVGCTPRPNSSPGRKINGFSLNKKLRGPSDRRKAASVDQMVEGGVTLFHFDDYIGKSLVPHREIMN
jgi:hypothetical protein